jgi:hypothetical protein
MSAAHAGDRLNTGWLPPEEKVLYMECYCDLVGCEQAFSIVLCEDIWIQQPTSFEPRQCTPGIRKSHNCTTIWGRSYKADVGMF